MEGKLEYDPKDKSWWPKREMGTPLDPYNQIPVIPKDSGEYKEYTTFAEETFDALREEGKETGWEFVTESSGIKIYRKAEEGSPIARFCGRGIIQASIEVVRVHLAHIDLRGHWDELFLAAKYTLQLEPEIRIAHFKFKAPWPIKNRDFAIMAGEKLFDNDETGYEYVLFAKSVKRDDIPETSDFVRGELLTSGFVIKPLENDPKTGDPRCDVTYVVQGTPNGWIPNWAVNIANKQQPLCIKKLDEVIQKSKKGMIDLLNSWCDLDESKWSEKTTSDIFQAVIRKYSIQKDMLCDPITFFLTGTRTPDEPVFKTMQKWGKVKSLVKLWWKLEMYAKTIPVKYKEALGKYNTLVEKAGADKVDALLTEFKAELENVAGNEEAEKETKEANNEVEEEEEAKKETEGEEKETEGEEKEKKETEGEEKESS